MICDDDIDLLQLFGQALRSKYDVILVDSGEVCIDKFIEEKKRGNKIHLILLDYRLGDMSGDFVARTIKQYNGPKIILFSAYNLDDSLLKELEESDCIAKYVKKPIHLNNLIKLVEETINQIETVSQNG
jgi:CheY-like chemotaxis protein